MLYSVSDITCYFNSKGQVNELAFSGLVPKNLLDACIYLCVYTRAPVLFGTVFKSCNSQRNFLCFLLFEM